MSVLRLGRPFTALMLAVGLLLLTASSGAAQAPRQDSVVGSGSTTFGCGTTFVIDARSGPSGENPTGQVTCGTFFAGPVTCLDVQGNVARVLVDTPQFGLVELRITDNGATGDQLGGIPVSGPDCAGPETAKVDFGFSGDIAITDAQPPPPLPTSKEQCKKGGFAMFGFKNQGQCVAFVQRGPRSNK